MRPTDILLRSAAALILMWSFSGAALAQTAAAPQGGDRVISGLRLSGDQPIQIESDKLEVREQENVAIFTGNVSVTQGSTVLKSGSMTVHYAKDGGSATTGSSRIERLQVDDKVYVKTDKQVATGDRGEFNLKTEVLTLSGSKVVLSEGPNVLVGCKLTVQMNSGRAQVDGCANQQKRVIMSITPGSRAN
jgi:lipopolysaccharide export system protein LptA